MILSFLFLTVGSFFNSFRERNPILRIKTIYLYGGKNTLRWEKYVFSSTNRAVKIGIPLIFTAYKNDRIYINTDTLPL